jgi:dTDP-4-dehydrorhamnose 3,5-epimerase
MLHGVKVKKVRVNSDERGLFSELLRTDWKDFVEEDVSQVNLSFSYPNIIRAWHRHLKGQVDYLAVLEGTIKVCIYDEGSGELDEIILTGHDIQVIRIPGIYWHGFKVISDKTAWLLYFINKLYDYEKPDEERRPWNDPTITPKSINGKTHDPRIGKPWDWNYPPHK